MSHDWRPKGALALVALGFFGGCDGDVTAREGPVSVSFPGEPVRTTSTVETPLGDIEARTWSWPDSAGGRDGGVRLELTVSDSPFRGADANDAFRERVLDGSRDGLLGVTEGRLLDEAAVVVDGVTGPGIGNRGRARRGYADRAGVLGRAKHGSGIGVR